jgi:hypothetical protein
MGEIANIDFWDQLVQNLPFTIIVLAFMISIALIVFRYANTLNKAFKNIVEENKDRIAADKKERLEFQERFNIQMKEMIEFYQSTNRLQPMLEKFMEKFPKVESMFQILNQDDKQYYELLEVILSRLKYSFKINFRNGSSVEKAKESIKKAHEHIIEEIAKEENLINKEYHVLFADFLKEKIEKLIVILSKLKVDESDNEFFHDSSTFKAMSVDTYFRNLKITLNFMRIKLSDFIAEGKSSMKKSLEDYFDALDSKDDDKMIDRVIKSIDDATEKDVFGFNF